MALGTHRNKLDHLHIPLHPLHPRHRTLGVWNLASASRSAPGADVAAQVDVDGRRHRRQSRCCCSIDYRWLMTAACPSTARRWACWPAWRSPAEGAGRAPLAAVRPDATPAVGVREDRRHPRAGALVHLDETGARRRPLRPVRSVAAVSAHVVPVALVLKQPDLGTALVTFAIAMTMILFAKVKWRDLVVVLAAGVGGSVLRLIATSSRTRSSASRRSSTRRRRDRRRLSRHPERSSRSARDSGAARAGAKERRTCSRSSPSSTPTSSSRCGPRSTASSACVLLLALYTVLVLARARRRRATRAIGSAASSRSAWRRCSSGTRSSTSGW